MLKGTPKPGTEARTARNTVQEMDLASVCRVVRIAIAIATNTHCNATSFNRAVDLMIRFCE